MFWIQHALTGLAAGAALSLAGLGLVLTYKATGVFNFAHGAIGVLVAYVLFHLNSEWGVPVAIAAPLAIVVIGPAIGVLLERAVFRPLHRAGATTTEKLVATLGVFVAALGIVFAAWTGKPRSGVSLFSRRGFELGADLRLGYNDVGNIAVLVVVAALLWALFRFTHLGTEIRAVVDRPDLAELASVNANRVAGIAWALGAGMAGLAGVLLSQGAGRLDPSSLSLVLIETFSIVVLARLTSLPIAVGAGVLLLGAGQQLLRQTSVSGGVGLTGEIWDALKPNLSVVILFAALLLYKRLDIVGEAAERVQRLATPLAASARRARVVAPVVAVGLLVLPAALDADGLDRAHGFLAFAVIFTSIVAVTGFSGQITLGQAGYAGLGAWTAARLVNEFDMPVIIAMILGALLAMVAGLLTGWPALQRRGLFLALTTLAFGLLIYRFVLSNVDFAQGADALQVARPSLFGWDLGGPVAFYYFELVWVGLMVLWARNLRAGRLGRALGAMRDSEAGARSIGIGLRSYKLFIFGVSAFMAGIGGALLSQKSGVFAAESFFPLQSLFWFAVVVVAGVTSLVGAVVGAFIWVMLEVVLDREGLSQFAIGLGALLLGRLPGGSLVGMARVAADRMGLASRRALASAGREAAEPPPGPKLVPSAYAVRLLAANGRAEPTEPSRAVHS